MTPAYRLKSYTFCLLLTFHSHSISSQKSLSILSRIFDKPFVLKQCVLSNTSVLRSIGNAQWLVGRIQPHMPACGLFRGPNGTWGKKKYFFFLSCQISRKFPCWCHQSYNCWALQILRVCWLYYISKFTEFVDTVRYFQKWPSRNPMIFLFQVLLCGPKEVWPYLLPARVSSW